jgi:hypothetical protein
MKGELIVVFDLHLKRAWLISGIVFFFLMMLPMRGFADCIACFQLKGVEVILKDGRIVTGHMPWNDSWVAVRTKTKKKFPDIVFELGKTGSVSVYTHLKSIKYPINGVVATQKPLRIPISDVKQLIAKPGGFEGVDGATRLPVVSERIADLLQTPPEAFCTWDANVADVYWVSYNKNIPKAQIDCLCARQAKKVTDCGISAETTDVFHLCFFYD